MQPVLYWAPERRGSLWARAWDLVWASPLTDALLAEGKKTIEQAELRGQIDTMALRQMPEKLKESEIPAAENAWLAREQLVLAHDGKIGEAKKLLEEVVDTPDGQPKRSRSRSRRARASPNQGR